MKSLRKILILSIERNASKSILIATKLSKNKYEIHCTSNLNFGAFLGNSVTIHNNTVSIYGENYINYIKKTINSIKPDLVISGSDYDNVILSYLKYYFLEYNIYLICGSTEFCKLGYDKYLIHTKFNKNDVNIYFPNTYLIDENFIFPSDIKLPFILKPRYGNSSDGVKIIKNKDEINCIERNGDYLIQDIVFHNDTNNVGLLFNFDGSICQTEEYSLQILKSKQGLVIGCFLSKNSLYKGVPIQGVIIKKIDKKILQFANYINGEGPINIQFKITPDNSIFVFDINLRCTGITSLRA